MHIHDLACQQMGGLSILMKRGWTVLQHVVVIIFAILKNP
jgi:hypothetical protein